MRMRETPGSIIRKARTTMKLSQDEVLAVLSRQGHKITPRQLQRYEDKRTHASSVEMPTSLWVAFCEVLHIPVQSLYTGYSKKEHLKALSEQDEQ